MSHPPGVPSLRSHIARLVDPDEQRPPHAVINIILTAVDILCVPLFVALGSRLVGAGDDAAGLDVAAFGAQLSSDPLGALSAFSGVLARGVIGWTAMLPVSGSSFRRPPLLQSVAHFMRREPQVLGFGVYLVLYPVVAMVLPRRSDKPPAAKE